MDDCVASLYLLGVVLIVLCPLSAQQQGAAKTFLPDLLFMRRRNDGCNHLKIGSRFRDAYMLPCV